MYNVFNCNAFIFSLVAKFHRDKLCWELASSHRVQSWKEWMSHGVSEKSDLLYTRHYHTLFRTSDCHVNSLFAHCLASLDQSSAWCWMEFSDI